MRKLLLVAGGLVMAFLIAMVVWPGCVLHGRVLPNEASALASLRSIHEAQVTYSQNHQDRGFAPDLAVLVSGGKIDASLAAGRKIGYTFVYTPGDKVDGAIRSYTITATPERPSSAGQVRFFSDQTGEIHYDASAAADATSRIIQ